MTKEAFLQAILSRINLAFLNSEAAALKFKQLCNVCI